MNKWVEKSISFANSEGYLDKLHSVYPAQTEENRNIPKELLSQIKKAYEEKNMEELVKSISILSRKEVAPIKDSYMGSLKLNEVIIKNNPQTTQRIAKRILKLSWQEVVDRCNEPKSASKRLGNAFKVWVKTIGYPSVSLTDFEVSNSTVFLDASDKQMQWFAEKKLKCKLEEKGDVDFIAKLKNDKFIVGGAKFISASGGGQDNQYFNIVKFSEEKSGNVVRVAIVDGVVWFKESGRLYKRLCNSTGNALSALLLSDFIKENEK